MNEQVGYYLYYGQLKFQPVEYEGGRPKTWSVTPERGFVNIFARSATDYWDITRLVTFKSLPFELLISLETYAPMAPGSTMNSVIETWGKIKAQ